MKGDKKTIDYLNKAITAELTAINQYVLHSRMLKDWGVNKLGDKEFEESIDEMKHADAFIERVLFLGGLPNLQDLNKLKIGEDVAEVLRCDLDLEHEGRKLYAEAVAYAESVGDYVTRDLFAKVLADEEEHIDFLETQLELIERVGIQNYTQSMM